MRLIDTTTLRIQKFGDKPPPYTILSHTWGEGEVIFQDCLHIPSRTPSEKAGWIKVKGACAQAKQDGYKYVWIDTNCIDKSDNTELDEAINSMFSWYGRAERCYVYLADVPDDGVYLDKDSGSLKVTNTFCRSRWFTRGWTLQELLAPKDVVFFSRGWKCLGTKIDLQLPLSQITGISTDYLVNKKEVWTACISQKMSWMSRRETTRVEDLAYSLLGIFGISMPFLYGDGTRAFLRLQEAIINVTDDHTIFCWEWDQAVDCSWASVLAPCPKAFANSAKYTPRLWQNDEKFLPYKNSNVGLSIELPLVQMADPSVVLAVLDVQVRADDEGNHYRVGIPLRAGRSYQRLPFPLGPVPVNDGMLGGGTGIYINTTEKLPHHRIKESDLAYQQSQSRQFQDDLKKASKSRAGFFLALHFDVSEIELVSAHPGVELLRSISMVTFTDHIADFMVTGLRIKQEGIGESIVLLAVRKSGADYLHNTHVFPLKKSYDNDRVKKDIARLQSAQALSDISYPKGGDVCVALGGSFPFSGSGGPTVKTVQVWSKRTAGVSGTTRPRVKKFKRGFFRRLLPSRS